MADASRGGKGGKKKRRSMRRKAYRARHCLQAWRNKARRRARHRAKHPNDKEILKAKRWVGLPSK